MILSQDVESCRFWDIVTQWAQEQFLHEHLVARALARGVVRDGLRFQSVDVSCPDPHKSELRGEPLVGYAAKVGELPVFIRRRALAHLISVAQRAAVPDRQILQDEFVAKQDFLNWLDERRFPPPAFLFAARAWGPTPAGANRSSLAPQK